MSTELLGAIVGGLIGISGVFITQRGSRLLKELELRQKEHQAKRDSMTEVYKNLLTVINHFPDESPIDILRNINFAPNYRLENYDAVFTSLEYMLENYRNQLNMSYIDSQRKSDLEIQISNLEYAQKRLVINKDSYFKAKKDFSFFKESDKAIFDLYASQDVRNSLVRFDVTTSNVFISGRSVGDPDDPNKNHIKMAKREVIYAMRSDIGTN